MEKDYKTDFEKFLAHTNEKKVLLDEIVKDIKKINAETLIDIGAGNGLLAIPLSKQVNKYAAVESKRKFVEILRNSGLFTLEGDFPFNIDEKFDIALSSHSLSYDEKDFAPYIRKAMDLLNKGGVFIIITFRGQEDDWTDLLKNIGLPQMDHNRIGYNSIIELLNSLGSVVMRKVTTNVEAKTIEDMLDVLSFVYHGGNIIQKNEFTAKYDKVRKILNSKYMNNEKYSFPFQHLFITTKKG